MTTRPNPRRAARLNAYAQFASIFVMVIPCIVLVGWLTGNETLKRIHPGLVAMNPVTAVSFILAGAALWLQRQPGRSLAGAGKGSSSHIAARVMGVAVALVGLLALGAILLNVPGIDQALFHDQLGIGSATPNRMSPTTALDFILMGAALALVDVEIGNGVRPAQSLAILAAWIALLAMIGYLYGSTSLYQVKAFIPMAVHTAVTFAALSTGFLSARADSGLMARMTSDSAGGSMIRQMLVVIIGAPILLGWLVSMRANSSNPTFGFSLLVVLIIVVFTLITWSNAISLDRKEGERDRAVEGLRQAQTHLETRVQERTADLGQVLTEIASGIHVLGSSAAQIVHSSTQLTSSAAETAAAVSQISATVEEIRQTDHASSEIASHVSDSAQNAAHISQDGRKSTEETGRCIQRIQEQMESITHSMTNLSEQSTTISEIIAVVEDLAQQSNLLAVNAAIEAAKAGEHGKGFAVVAQEVKHLAGQSRQATTQVRAILSDIQKATGRAMIASEHGSKAVEAGVAQSAQAGASILVLAESIADAAQAATQIAATTQQQLIGIDQVAIAMDHVKTVSHQNEESARQLEDSARSINDLGQRLKSLVDQYKENG